MSVLSRFQGNALSARIFRSAFLSVGGFGFSQVLRLASNLILARLLFPEAFGLMALVSVIVQGLYQFSDVGVTPAILQSKRGDDKDFLNTAWTIQVFRGFGLWLVACALAYPMALLYDEPLLAQVLPVAAFSLAISGFDPTKIDTANRHLILGRATAIDMGVQLIGIGSAVLLAWYFQSVWALVVSGLFGALAQLILNSRFLPGPLNSLRWEREAVSELINFGKWIFLSTIAGFLALQADKLILGKYLTLDTFGVYNIGFFLASFPLMLGTMVTHKLLIPIYRETPPKASPENFRRLRKMRCLVTFGLLLMVAGFGIAGVWLIDLMYDDRYALAGPIVVLIALMQMPAIIALTYDLAALAAGDSRRFFVVSAARAVLTIVTLLIGLELAGLFGGLLARGAALVAVYPFVVWLARKTGAWDPLHDMVFAAMALVLGAGIGWMHWDALAALVSFAR